MSWGNKKKMNIIRQFFFLFNCFLLIYLPHSAKKIPNKYFWGTSFFTGGNDFSRKYTPL